MLVRLSSPILFASESLPGPCAEKNWLVAYPSSRAAPVTVGEWSSLGLCPCTGVSLAMGRLALPPDESSVPWPEIPWRIDTIPPNLIDWGWRY